VGWREVGRYPLYLTWGVNVISDLADQADDMEKRRESVSSTVWVAVLLMIADGLDGMGYDGGTDGESVNVKDLGQLGMIIDNNDAERYVLLEEWLHPEGLAR
jgi:hypothetical protein